MMEIKRKNESAHLKAFEVDLSSFQSILQFKASLQQWLSHLQMHPSIQLLINDAGIFAASSTCTSEVYDRNSPVSSRIVNVTSFTHGSDQKETHMLMSTSIPNSPEVGISSILVAALASPEHLEFTFLVERARLSALLCFHMMLNLQRNFGIHRLIYS
ncbi:uncharacterized protein LOC112179438 [Rosa chinensis]|uniref:uncharacterized protein LOC112179438 n=1 Tax=Rosa chinensis TaxID=74649 RepID=UPI001AD92961|nr:uncharacterized protein LOC112179438 [Rosa chinensis]